MYLGYQLIFLGSIVQLYLDSIAYFLFSDDNITTTGNVSFPDSSQFRIRENSDPATNSACSNKGELIYDTTDDQLQFCTTTGVAASAVWTAVDSGGGSDFEDVFGNDADKVLTTSNNNITIDAGSADFLITASNVSIDSSGNITVGGTVDGIDLSALAFSNIATRAKKAVFVPEFPAYTVEGDGSNNRGTLISDFVDAGGSDKRNFYEWNTRQATLHDIDVIIKYQLPLDFDSFTSAPLSVDYNTSDGVTGTNKLDVLLYDTAGTAVSLTGGGSLANASWTTANITFGGSPTFTAGSTITLHLRLSAKSSGWTRVSTIVLSYNGK